MLSSCAHASGLRKPRASQPCRRSVVNALPNLLQWTEGPTLQKRLFEAVEDTGYGAFVSSTEAQKVSKLVDELERCNGAASTSSVNRLTGAWKLCYTTEKSVHSIVKTLPVDSITQTIDISSARVSNSIKLSIWGAGILATAPLTVEGPTRIAYAFDGLYLEAFGKKMKLPFAPRGGGWTEATYLDDGCRLMRNSLGDTLLFKKDM